MQWWTWVAGGPDSAWWPRALMSLGIPAIVTMWAAWRHRQHLTRRLVGLTLAATAGSFVLSKWCEWPDGETSLTIVPVFLLALAVLNWQRRVLAPSVAFAASFVSTLIPDTLHVWIRFYDAANPSWWFLRGIGGAGIIDGLLLYSALSAALQGYAHWRFKRLALEATSL